MLQKKLIYAVLNNNFLYYECVEWINNHSNTWLIVSNVGSSHTQAFWPSTEKIIVSLWLVLKEELLVFYSKYTYAFI